MDVRSMMMKVVCGTPAPRRSRPLLQGSAPQQPPSVWACGRTVDAFVDAVIVGTRRGRQRRQYLIELFSSHGEKMNGFLPFSLLGAESTPFASVLRAEVASVLRAQDPPSSARALSTCLFKTDAHTKLSPPPAAAERGASGGRCKGGCPPFSSCLLHVRPSCTAARRN